MSKLIGHTSVNINNEYILIFGGLLESANQNEYSDQLRVYEISSESCIPIILSEGEKPSPRNFHSAISHDHKMILFGGKSNGYLADVWQFEFNSKESVGKWTKLTTVNDQVISPRFGHSAEIYKDSMIIFGGYDSDGFVSNQVFELNLKTFEWKCRSLKNRKNNEILGRYFHSSLIYNNLLIISGGKQSGNIPINDVLLIDLENLSESEYLNCKIKKIPQNISRYGHKSWIENDRLFLIGGCNSNHDFTTLHSLNLSEKNEWREENFHFLSRVFNNSEFGPVFHSLTIYTPHELTFVVYYFVWGGKYQQSISNINAKENNGKLSMLNEDIFRMILEYLPVHDLNNVQLIGKDCQLSQLSIEDKLWKKFLLSKSQNVSPRRSGVNYYNLALHSRTFYQQSKNHIIELGRIKTLIEFQFKPKQEILKQDIQQLVKETENNLHEFRITVIGSSNVGKTSMQIVLAMNEFPQEYIPTVFESEHPIPVTLKNQTFTLQMRDTAGGYDYEIIRYLSYSPPPDLTIVVYSIYNLDSFHRVKDTFVEETRLHSPKTPILLLGTKSDLRNYNPGENFYSKEKPRIVSYEEGENLARELKCLSFTEVSSLKMVGIEELKELIVKCCLLQDSQVSNNGKPKCLIQ
ncbi:rho family small GTPase [Naegleria gruberi]|uniref:Rho family small GTPase n=1 Tax=Naegleria gruberi TaxID=5762 RepID=D2VI52_NAEGR|nr:rho family small GTPase [Naegleria gruberi]EFC43530.1 rho family small GTPase [Naegleria gruberi]|eukprot:XP_002676274.1 rho family small GTPase [Naegleria gruberi strain NEG-M]